MQKSGQQVFRRRYVTSPFDSFFWQVVNHSGGGLCAISCEEGEPTRVITRGQSAPLLFPFVTHCHTSFPRWQSLVTRRVCNGAMSREMRPCRDGTREHIMTNKWMWWLLPLLAVGVWWLGYAGDANGVWPWRHEMLLLTGLLGMTYMTIS